jgi:competence ComEA-like helix-hairpin-helix protein
MTNGRVSKKSNKSILYLALLCLLIFLIQSYCLYIFPGGAGVTKTNGGIYVEIDDGRSSVVNVIEGPEKIEELKHTYNIDSELKNGTKIIFEGDNSARIGRISGLKSISLGIPIGINSATAEDLEALPGIGEKLARRIVAYRSENGPFMDFDSIPDVNGMGEKKLSRIRPFINLD